MGYISESVTQPTVVYSLENISIKKIDCGDNYSVATTTGASILVTGDLAGGKLGLGSAWVNGYILEFKEVPGLKNVM
jgi:hypothetical protein